MQRRDCALRAEAHDGLLAAARGAGLAAESQPISQWPKFEFAERETIRADLTRSPSGPAGSEPKSPRKMVGLVRKKHVAEDADSRKYRRDSTHSSPAINTHHRFLSRV